VDRLTWEDSCVSRDTEQDTFMAKTCGMWATSDLSQTIAESKLSVKSCSNSSGVETGGSWSSVQCDEPLIVCRAERLCSCFSMFFISSVKPRCVIPDFSGSTL